MRRTCAAVGRSHLSYVGRVVELVCPRASYDALETECSLLEVASREWLPSEYCLRLSCCLAHPTTRSRLGRPPSPVVLSLRSGEILLASLGLDSRSAGRPQLTLNHPLLDRRPPTTPHRPHQRRHRLRDTPLWLNPTNGPRDATDTLRVLLLRIEYRRGFITDDPAPLVARAFPVSGDDSLEFKSERCFFILERVDACVFGEDAGVGLVVAWKGRGEGCWCCMGDAGGAVEGVSAGFGFTEVF